MSELSKFESRTGKIGCKPAETYEFVTDIRNFKRFVLNGNINELQIDRESCSFNISPLGNLSLRISKKEPDKRVVYSGVALKSNDFTLLLDIKEAPAGMSEVIISINAEMDPMMRMIASRPVAQFLETLIDKMEKFKDWNDTMV